MSVELQPNSPSDELYAERFATGDYAETYVTRMREPVETDRTPSRQLLAGDVLRRTCALGGAACASQGCQAPEGYDNIDRYCSDLNLQDVTERLGLPNKNVLMVGVTKDNVGFYDQIDTHDDLTTNSVGIRELPGFNAFFARTSEQIALGARLADCGFAVVSFTDVNNEPVNGFVHLTRTNMQGESKLAHEIEGQPASSFEYFVHEALNHYGGTLESVNVHVVAAIKVENYLWKSKTKHPEDAFPGWFHQGLLRNLTNPDWQAGDPIDAADTWAPRYRDMVRYQIMRSGIKPEQLHEDRVIDPADLHLGHASNRAGKDGKMPEGRDLYVVIPNTI